MCNILFIPKIMNNGFAYKYKKITLFNSNFFLYVM